MKPVHIDGALYVAMAVFAAIQLTFSSDDVYKYINPGLVFWGKHVAGWILAGATGLKMYRSTSYGDAVAEKKNGNGHAPPPVTDSTATKTP